MALTIPEGVRFVVSHLPYSKDRVCFIHAVKRAIANPTEEIIARTIEGPYYACIDCEALPHNERPR